MSLRRGHRNIEVFDISLMAVVTKAMGAFLVLMLILLPYYSSDPNYQASAEELAQKLKDAQARLEELEKSAGKFAEDPEALKRLLKETRERLKEANDLILQLQRSLDQAWAQVSRLQDRNKELESIFARLQQQISQQQQQIAQQQQQIVQQQAQIAALQRQLQQQQLETTQLKQQLDQSNDRNVVDSFAVTLTWQGCDGDDFDLFVEPLEPSGQTKVVEGWPAYTLGRVPDPPKTAKAFRHQSNWAESPGASPQDRQAGKYEIWNQALVEAADKFAVVINRSAMSRTGPPESCTYLVTAVWRVAGERNQLYTWSSAMKGGFPAASVSELACYLTRIPNGFELKVPDAAQDEAHRRRVAALQTAKNFPTR